LIGKISDEEYLDFKRLFHRKIEKFMSLLSEQIKPVYQFKNYAYHMGKINPKSPVVWSTFYFTDDEETQVNEYPNINFSYEEYGIQLSLNAETQPSVKKMVSLIEKNPGEFNSLAKNLSGFNFSLYYKYQYLPQNRFIWNLIPGYPKEMSTFTAEEALSTIENFERSWHDYTKTLFFEMKTGKHKHSSGRFFSEKELAFAQSSNPKPNYVIRIEKRYSANEVDKLKKSVVTFFKNEILELKKLVEFVVK
jgi:hypothetical protein